MRRVALLCSRRLPVVARGATPWRRTSVAGVHASAPRLNLEGKADGEAGDAAAAPVGGGDAAMPDAESLFESIFGSATRKTTDSSSAVPDLSFRSEDGDGVDKVFDSLFGKKASRSVTSDLKYFPLYPHTVKKWVDMAKSPPGYYNRFGDWVEVDSWSLDENSVNLTPHVISSQVYRHSIPDDLKGHYRFGVKPDEVEEVDLHPKLRNILSFHFATNPEVIHFRKQREVEKWGRFKGDTGSPEVQVAVMTLRIRSLVDHVRTNRKDQVSRRKLQKLLTRRKAMMEYLKRKKIKTYYRVINYLNLRDAVTRPWKQ